MKIAIFGLTACGKSYHGKKMAKFFHLKYISGSSILLNTSGLKIKKVPHFWIRKRALNLAKHRLKNPYFDLATDKKILEITEKEDNIVVDSWTTPWLYKGRDLLRISISANLDARTEMAYLSTRKKVFTKRILREKIIKKDLDNFIIFKKLYDINLMDASVFDVSLDISKIYTNPSMASKILCSQIERFRTKNAIY